MQTALAVLGNKRMATPGADVAVARLLNAMKPLAEPLATARRRVTIDVLAGRDISGLSQAEMMKLNLDIAEAEKQLLDQEVEVDLPLAYKLKMADLPKEQTGSDGWRNCEGLGAIVSDLGMLFVMDEEEKK